MTLNCRNLPTSTQGSFAEGQLLVLMAQKLPVGFQRSRLIAVNDR
ncbi:MAG: hypothetical protein V2I74_09170 [Erythrobacter sp.]|jgi:hypothetical protein|nr:hypothetical protein [Erythrobacter sp.]